LRFAGLGACPSFAKATEGLPSEALAKED
ncbi:MAG: hypothetical protein JWO28_1089, partial [Hyphomicrobiales bacterium]|nr:hypothetical protein [Hyphomicrobiales bacterium]